jgi:hypothetical protein
MPKVAELVTRLRAEEVALIAEIQAPILILNARGHLIIRMLLRLGQRLIHPLVLPVH